MVDVGGGGVPGMRLGILSLLLAILSMHGVQYMSAGAHAPAAVTADQMLDAAAVTVLPLAPVALAADLGTTMAPERTAAASAVATGSMPGDGVPAHVWSLCLAVLLAGLALVSAALARRANAAPVRESTPRSRGPLSRSRPPRPPELSVLCLLRI